MLSLSRARQSEVPSAVKSCGDFADLVEDYAKQMPLVPKSGSDLRPFSTFSVLAEDQAGQDRNPWPNPWPSIDQASPLAIYYVPQFPPC